MKIPLVSKISIVVAMSRNRAIGFGQSMPWGKFPADLKRFRDITLRHPVIMGRKTYESIGKPLAARVNIVITSKRDYRHRECFSFQSLVDAFEWACNMDTDVFVIGGESVYRQALPYSEKIFMTYIDHDFPGDAFFPELVASMWETEEGDEELRRDWLYPYKFLTYKSLGKNEKK